MSTCSTKQQKIEAVQREYARLKELEDLGYEVEETRAELAAMEAAIGDYKKMQAELVSTDRVQEVGEGKLAEINREKPRYKGAPVTITRVWTVDSKTYVNIKYKNGSEYKGIAAELVTLDQKDLKGMVLFSAPTDEAPKKGRNILEKGLMTDGKKFLNVFDDLVQMDNVAEDKEHLGLLRRTLETVVGPLARALPEIGIYLDETAKRNSGAIVFGAKDADILLSRGLDAQAYGNEMSLAEKYVHEMIHAATYWAMNAGTRVSAKIMNRLIQLHRRAMEEIRVEDLLPEVSINAKAEMETAKATYAYINGSIEEFLAYALTNKRVLAKLAEIDVRPMKEEPKGLLDKVVHWLGKLMDLMVDTWRKEPRSMKADQLAVKLVYELMQINNEVSEAKKASLADKIEDFIETADTYLAEKLDGLVKKQTSKAMEPRPVGQGKVKEAAWVLRNMAQLVGHPELAGTLRAVLEDLKLKPEGTIQNFVQKMKNTDAYQDIMEEVGLMSLQVDKNRETTAASVDKIVSGAFKQYDGKTKKVLYKGMLALDGTLLVNEYGKEAVEYYRDEKKRKAKIAQLEAELAQNSTKQEMAYYKYQIDGLVEYMDTGKGGLIQLKNAEAIARMMGTRYRKSVADEKVKKLIDEITSLKAIERIEASTLEELVEVMEREQDGVLAMAAMRKGFDEYVSTREDAESRLNRRKNYIRETYDRYTTSTVAMISERLQMEREGYKLVRELPVGMIGPKNRMGLYVSSNMVQLPFNRSGVRYTGDKQQGRTLFEQRVKVGDADAVKRAREDLQRAKDLASRMVEDVMNGRNVVDNGVMSMHVNEEGFATDYRYNVSMEDKVKYMKLSVSPSEAIGRTWAHQVDMEETQGLNDIAWQEMMRDMAKNYTGEGKGVTGDSYVLIDAKSPNADIRDIVRIMPEDFKDKLRIIKKAAKEGYISNDDVEKVVGKEVMDDLYAFQLKRLKQQLVAGKFAVRRDMLPKIFGFRDLSIVNMRGVKNLPAEIKNVIKVAENMWKEVVSIYSVNVVIKTLMVPVENVISNTMKVVTGHGSMTEVLQAQIEGWKGLNQWVKDEARQKELIALLNAYPNEAKYRNELARLEASMSKNPVKPLVDAGLYQHIMEDIGTGDFSSSSRLANWMNAKMEGWPTFVKTAVGYAFVTENTALFRALQKFTMFGDFVARYSEFILAREKAKKKRAKEGKPFTAEELTGFEKKLLKKVTRDFINYADPDSQLWQYVQDMGFARFTKYGIGIQKVVKDQAMDHPLRFVLSLLGQEGMEEVTGYNPASTDEMSWLTGHSLFMPGPGGILQGLYGNLIPIYNHVKRL